MDSGEAEIGYSMLLEEADRISELDAEFAAAMLSLAANLPLYRLEAATTVALTERASALGNSDRPRMLVERAALGLGKVMAGDPAAKALLLELARASSSDVGIGHRQSSVAGWGLVWLEEYEAARTQLAWAVEVQRGGGALRYLPQSLHPLAELDFRVGRWLPALAEAQQAITLFEETGQRTERGFAAATCARIEAALGRDDDCRAHASEAFASDAAVGLRMATAYAASALGLLDLGRGDPEGAIAALEPVAAVMRDGEVAEPWLVQWAPDLIEAYIHAGKLDRAAETLAGFESQAHATGRISALGAAARCRGILGGDDVSFTEALKLHDRVPTPFERGRTELAYGERLRRTGHRAEARERLNGALHVFERLGAEPWAERTRAELRASGKTVRTPIQRIDDELTPQELQVAALVADGATNREAAASLFLSGKTIEFHLRNVYRKLGIRSRTELARVMSAPAALADAGAQL
jgi:DNA-binding CsgD family transcriptional regulator